MIAGVVRIHENGLVVAEYHLCNIAETSGQRLYRTCRKFVPYSTFHYGTPVHHAGNIPAERNYPSAADGFGLRSVFSHAPLGERVFPNLGQQRSAYLISAFPAFCQFYHFKHSFGLRTASGNSGRSDYTLALLLSEPGSSSHTGYLPCRGGFGVFIPEDVRDTLKYSLLLRGKYCSASCRAKKCRKRAANSLERYSSGLLFKHQTEHPAHFLGVASVVRKRPGYLPYFMRADKRQLLLTGAAETFRKYKAGLISFNQPVGMILGAYAED